MLENETELSGTEQAAQLEPLERRFEDLSLTEVVQQMIRRPLQTWAGLTQTLKPPVVEPDIDSDIDSDIDEIDEPQDERRAVSAPVIVGSVKKKAARPSVATSVAINWRELTPLGGMAIAFLITLVGSVMLETVRGIPADERLPIAGPILLVGMAVMAVITWHTIVFKRLPPLVPEPAGADEAAEQPVEQSAGQSAEQSQNLATNFVEKPVANPAERFIDRLITTYGGRVLLAGLAIIWTGGAWAFNVDNTFTALGVFCWIMSVLTWTAVLVDQGVNVGAALRQRYARIANWLKRPTLPGLSWTVVALLVILFVGAVLRFSRTDAYPPEMTSDHVEKALDALRVYENARDGGRSIFFPNNGGRESFQMYYLAALKGLTALPFGLPLLVLGTALEGMVGILLTFWLGRTIIGDEDRQLGNLTGLIMAALVATSFWHVLLSRLGLRIITTTLIASLVFGFLARALRYNRRSDYLITGLVLGVGMYMYQAVRMLPLVVVVGFLLALFMRGRTKRTALRYITNMAALVIVALAVFVPLGHYSIQYPNEFWERTTGRLFGENGLSNPAQGLETLRKNLPGLADNMARSALMFNFRGDMSWFNGEPSGTPELDFYSGALFILGLGIVLVRIVRRRDPIDWLLPIGIVIMLFPAALSIAYTIEVPSLTRASGTLPLVYLLAALPLALMIQMVARRVPVPWARWAIYAVVIIFLVLGTASNVQAYFGDAMSNYRDSTLPHRQAGQILKGFIDSTGAPGNAFVPAFPYWWDFRALALESGDPHWANIIWRPGLKQNFFDLIMRDMGTPYEIKPDRQVMFFVNPQDKEMQNMLAELLPQGSTIQVSSYKPDRDFLLYTVPPLGCDWLKAHLPRVPAACQNAQSTGPDQAPTPTPEPTEAP